jgi:lipopolysaccharide heptosyltransferase II
MRACGAVQALIIKIAPIGDTIMALPMVAALRRRYPGARVIWIGGETTADLVRIAGDVEVIPVNEHRFGRGSLLERVSEALEVCRKLRRRRFDLAIVAHANKRFRALTLALTLTTSVGEWRSFHSTRSKARLWAVPGRYHGDEYVRLITGVDGPDAEPAELPTTKLPLSDSMLSRFDGSTANLVVLAPGGAWGFSGEQPLRRWPLESYRLLAVELLGRGLRVVLTGAPSDDWARAAFSGLPVIDLISRTSLTDQLALFGACAVVVTHDSGPLHVAQLAGAPAVALFGPTNPAEYVRDPTRVRVIWGGAGLVCRPCHTSRGFAPCNDNRCIKGIPVQEVVSAVEEIIARNRFRPGPVAFESKC